MMQFLSNSQFFGSFLVIIFKVSLSQEAITFLGGQKVQDHLDPLYLMPKLHL